MTMDTEIECEECHKQYVPKKGFNPNFAFAWCKKCIDDYEKEYNARIREMTND